jgi:DNA-binding response OmpR family regulator
MARRILAIEDDPRVLAVLKKRLEFSGYEVVTAQDGTDGYRKARAESPDLIILDLILPGLNGYQICAMLKRDQNYRDIPVLMLTARSQERDIEEGMRVGADAYMIKPYDPNVLVARVKLLLELAEARRAEKKREEEAKAIKPPRRAVSEGPYRAT